MYVHADQIGQQSHQGPHPASTPPPPLRMVMRIGDPCGHAGGAAPQRAAIKVPTDGDAYWAYLSPDRVPLRARWWSCTAVNG